MFSLPRVSSAKNTESLGVRRHDAVLDAIVNHFNKVAGAVWPAMEIPLLGGAADFFPPGRARNIAHPRSERRKDRIEVLHNFLLAANHHAVAALQSPNTATRPNV